MNQKESLAPQKLWYKTKNVRKSEQGTLQLISWTENKNNKLYRHNTSLVKTYLSQITITDSKAVVHSINK